MKYERNTIAGLALLVGLSSCSPKFYQLDGKITDADLVSYGLEHNRVRFDYESSDGLQYGCFSVNNEISKNIWYCLKEGDSAINVILPVTAVKNTNMKEYIWNQSE